MYLYKLLTCTMFGLPSLPLNPFFNLSTFGVLWSKMYCVLENHNTHAHSLVIEPRLESTVMFI